MNSSCINIISLVVFAFVLCLPQQVSAANEKKSAGDVLKAARKALADAQSSSPAIEELRQALRGPDPSVRAAVFSAMIESNNPVLTTMAINEGRAHPDAVIQDLSARAAFQEVSHITLEPAENQSDSESWNKLIEWNKGASIHIRRYDWKTGKFLFGSSTQAGRISGTTLAFNRGYCGGSLTAEKQSWVFLGSVRCTFGKEQFVVPVKVRIR